MATLFRHTGEQRQYPQGASVQRLFVPIISIDRLSEDFLDLPVDDILALGDQALLRQFQRDRILQLQHQHELQRDHWLHEQRDQFQRFQKGQFQRLDASQQNAFQLLRERQRNESRHFVQMGQYQRFHLEREQLHSWYDLQRQKLLRLQLYDMNQFDCALRYQLHQLRSRQKEQVHQFVGDQSCGLLSQSIDEPDVLGPLVNNLYGMLASLERRQSCEFLLYLSGHGMDPDNVCLVPDTIKPHPARDDLREKEADKCYTVECQQEYLHAFYEAFAEIHAYKGPLGFVGGELYTHQRGYIGVLGVLGLWCEAHKLSPNVLFHHLVIVADCCFAGIWGATLESIMTSVTPCLQTYRDLLCKYPVSIQCATNKFEASHGGLFTPLWYFLQTASESQLKGNREKHDQHEEYKRRHGEPMSHDFETQHPWFISTSVYAPSCECFDNADFFVYLRGEQLNELQVNLSLADNRKALDDVCTPGSALGYDDIEKSFEYFLPLAHARVTALAGTALDLQNLLHKKKKQERDFDCPYLTPEQTQVDLKNIRKSICTIEQSLADLSKFLFMAVPRFRSGGYVLDKENKLTKATQDKLRKILRCRDEKRKIPSGVYVFQSGEGDMSLIVTPEQKQVILIDGAKTAECFRAAWDSTLRYLPRITHIIVTHHDLDHTYGIQLLLARYFVKRKSIPTLRHVTIYMNTRAHMRCIARNFCHEAEIETLAEMLKAKDLIDDSEIKHLFTDGTPQKCIEGDQFFVEPLLPKRSLVREFSAVPDKGKGTGQVSLRGNTTAANVLSINLVAVWKEKEAYLFTGDAHLQDVTKAAQKFLASHRKVKRFKYVDVPHHGSKRSNVMDVNDEDRGLARIPADNYLISHCGNQQNPSFETVAGILRSPECKKLHFLYPERRQALSCGKCAERTTCWHCKCVVKKDKKKIDTTLDDNRHKFFEFK